MKRALPARREALDPHGGEVDLPAGECVAITRVVQWRSGRNFIAPRNESDAIDAPGAAFAAR
ncbi:MAG: hypothetical protein Q8S73_26995 [Deltaproteobacteria bacterium]|nr:hypothetical protein [Myxococcales bacterium]MDP3217785.1 hypothetical protein [Deltaproteobacteria bacterium]